MDAGTRGNRLKGPIPVMAMALLAGAWLLVAVASVAEGASIPINDSRMLVVDETASYGLAGHFDNGVTIHFNVAITSPALVKVWISEGSQPYMETGTNSEVDSVWVIPDAGDFVLYVQNVGTDAGQMTVMVEESSNSKPAANTDSISYLLFCGIFLIPLLLVLIPVLYFIIKRVRKGEPIMQFGRGSRYQKQQMPYGGQYNAPPGLSPQAPNEGLYIPPSEPEDIKDRR